MIEPMLHSRAATLGDDKIHVWRASLADGPVRHRELERLLDAEECARAARFHIARHRRRFVVAHAILRLLLGAYGGRDPREVRFDFGPYGKPALHAAPDLSFSLSHSEDCALYAFARRADIGIDVEYRRADLASEEIAQRFFAPEEIAALRAVPQAMRTEAFFRCWTRKEAFVKAVGKGLSLPLDQFAVSLTPDMPARLVWVRGVADAAAEWSLTELPMPHGYTAALAVRGRGWQISLRDWQTPALTAEIRLTRHDNAAF
jgi:4'-phosphopantetheinyl transferase